MPSDGQCESYDITYPGNFLKAWRSVYCRSNRVENGSSGSEPSRCNYSPPSIGMSPDSAETTFWTARTHSLCLQLSRWSAEARALAEMPEDAQLAVCRRMPRNI